MPAGRDQVEPGGVQELRDQGRQDILHQKQLPTKVTKLPNGAGRANLSATRNGAVPGWNPHKMFIFPSISIR